jgi:hypothetical protein
LTIRDDNLRMPRRTKALWALVALLLVNAVLLVTQPALAVPRSLGNFFFGPKLIRAEVLLKEGNGARLYRIDRGVIRDKPGGGALTLREGDGTIQTIPVAPTATITVNGRPADLGMLRRGMSATVIWDGTSPAFEVRANRR